MPFQFERLRPSGLLLITPRRFDDERGWFMETYQRSAFAEAGIDLEFVQDNASLSSRGVLRGLHLQLPPHAQGKLVTVLRGRAWDVAVDIRPDSRTFGRSHGVELSAENRRLFYIPPGFAHGFVALADDTLFHYRCTAEYCREAERGIRWDDPALVIDWPLEAPIVCARDAGLPALSELLPELRAADGGVL